MIVNVYKINALVQYVKKPLNKGFFYIVLKKSQKLAQKTCKKACKKGVFLALKKGQKNVTLHGKKMC